MTIDELKKLACYIVADARNLTAKHTTEHAAPVNYACVFTQSPAEFDGMVATARELGAVVENTSMGPVFHIPPLQTEAGTLRLLKIRRADPKRPERGDADFTVSNYELFKQTYLGRSGFSLITRPNMEMIELIDPSFDVLAYYSHPTLAEVLKLDFDQPSGPTQP